MPIYEYECSKCGHSFDKLQKMSDPSLTDCPECHQPTLQKLVSAGGFQLKGGGWYVTDFRDKNKSSKKGESPDKADRKSDPELKKEPKKESQQSETKNSEPSKSEPNKSEKAAKSDSAS